MSKNVLLFEAWCWRISSVGKIYAERGVMRLDPRHFFLSDGGSGEEMEGVVGVVAGPHRDSNFVSNEE
jgi:hypothetical protein